MFRRLISQWVSSFLLTNFVRRYKTKSSLMKLKAAQAYIVGVKKIRLFCLGALGVFIAFVFIINGLLLMQTALFTYSMWSNEMKFIAALILGGIEFGGAIGVLIYLLREETWSRFTEIRKVVNLAIDENSKDKT